MIQRLAALLLLLSPALAAAAPEAAQSASFTLTLESPSEEETAVIHHVLVDHGTIEADVALLNEMFELPEPVSIVFLDSGEGSFYAPGDDGSGHQIQIDYQELLSEWALLIRDAPDASDDELAQLLVDNAEFALFHEVGHALISVLGLPVVGREEDAVDSLATVVVLDILEDPEAAATSARTWMLLAEADESELDQETLSGAHSLDAQRFGNIACLIFGSDPEGLDFLADEAQLDESRIESCPEDYARQLASWKTLLGPHMR